MKHAGPDGFISAANGEKGTMGSRKCLQFFLAICLGAYSMAVSAAPAKRFALVIGNASYDRLPLKNPVNDANDLTKALRASGFQVITRNNRNPDQMRKDLVEFREVLASNPGSVALFYFSGHGVQAGKRSLNYLLPVGATYKTESDAEIHGVDANSVLLRMHEGKPSLSILILDACRDAPLQSENRSSGSKGLARMEATSGSLIAFATSAGSTADDNTSGKNGLYTKHLLTALQAPGLRLEDVFKRVRREVERESNNKQSPEETSKLVSEEPFYFILGSGTKPGPGTNIASVELQPVPVPANTLPPVKVDVGSVFSDCDDCPKMTLVNQGKQTIDLPVAKGQSAQVVLAKREVGLASNLAVGVYEVTFKEWDACVADRGCPEGISDEGWGRGQQPVINVSWDDATAYTRWLSSRTGQRYRLLREAEWEYVARGGATSAFPWGDDAGSGQANCNQCGGVGFSGRQPAPVGSFARNAFGLYDVVGNVWEWTEDCFSDAVKSVSDLPPTPGACQRVIRGGAFNTFEKDATLDRRRSSTSATRSRSNGFRVAREQ